MNLLLLLSAILSALTGVGSTVRPAQAPAAVVQAPARAALATASAAVRHPLPITPSLVTLLRGDAPGFVVAPAEPIFAGRRRE